MTSNLYKRAAKAQSKHTGALGLFEQAAVQLEGAADEHLIVAAEAAYIADRHRQIENDADTAALAAKKSAEKIRALVG